jgi:acetylornithine deacetylase/succinyl-diaminopimelate desuccinylase-like protein
MLDFRDQQKQIDLNDIELLLPPAPTDHLKEVSMPMAILDTAPPLAGLGRKAQAWYCVILAALAAPLALADDWTVQTRSLYERMINTDTTADHAENTVRLIESMADDFTRASFPKSGIKILPYDRTAALIVRWPAVHAKARPILLLAHLDVVAAQPEEWTHAPFHLEERDGYYYGRGTLDDKQGATALVIALLELHAEGFRPTRDIILLLTGDEESEEHGAELAATSWRQWTDAEFALNADAGGGRFNVAGDAIGFTFQAAEKTYATFSVTARNRGGHSSKPRPDNAIYDLAASLTRLANYRFEPQLNETTRAYFAARQKSEPNALGDAMRRWLADDSDGAAADAIEANENEVGMTRTRCVATRIQGGHADNALAQKASATVNCRIMPGVTVESVGLELVKIVGNPALEVKVVYAETPGPASPLRKDVLAAYSAAVHRHFPGAPIIPEMSTVGTESRQFRIAGIPAYGVDGSWIVVPQDQRMHGQDERLPVKALGDDVEHWHDMIAALAGVSAAPR